MGRDIPYGLARALAWLGVLLIIFAVADFSLAFFFQIDITGPRAAGVIGGLLPRCFSEDDD